jgi:hypothetical protein
VGFCYQQEVEVVCIYYKIKAFLLFFLLASPRNRIWEKEEKGIGSAVDVKTETMRLDLFVIDANNLDFLLITKPHLTLNGSLVLVIGSALVSYPLSTFAL